MKKAISVILTSALCLAGISACNKAPDKTQVSTDDEESIEESVDESAGESNADDDVEQMMRNSHYLLDTIDEAEINKFVDAMYASNPQKGDNVQDVVDRVKETVGFPGNGWSVWSEKMSDFDIEFCNTSEMYHDGAWVDGRDNVCMMLWYGYEFEDFSLINDDPIIIAGNSKSYTNENYPGAAETYFHLYDKDRAMQVFEILNTRMATEYPDAVTSEDFVTDTSKMIKYKTGDSDVRAEVTYQYDENMDCWIVRCAVYFESIGVVDDTTETTSTSETGNEENITTVETVEQTKQDSTDN